MEISDMFEKKYLVFAVALALGANVAAETLPDGSTELENVNVTGHRRYNGLVTENSSEYSSFAATVGTKSPASSPTSRLKTATWTRWTNSPSRRPPCAC